MAIYTGRVKVAIDFLANVILGHIATDKNSYEQLCWRIEIHMGISFYLEKLQSSFRVPM